MSVWLFNLIGLRPDAVARSLWGARLALFVLMLCSGLSMAQSFTVASFNIHYITPNQADNDWPDRREAVRRVVGAMNADILAFQEMETFVGGHANSENRQLDWVLAHHRHYAVGAYGDARSFPITQPILYDPERFDLLDQGWFFYSQTPDQIYSRTFNGGYPAFTSWVKLKERNSGQPLWVLNNHFDYASGSNRRRSADLVAEFLAPIQCRQEAVIVLGDFNAPSFWPPMPFLEQQGLKLVPPSGGTHRLFLGWALLPAIDHILIGGPLERQGEIERFTGRYAGQFPSDHYPIAATVALTDRARPTDSVSETAGGGQLGAQAGC
ncbi:MAG: endonuclease/exonuclease/phosphatase family protein [Saccharospirillum sp.]